MNCYFCGLNLIPDQHNPTAMRCPDTKCQGYGFAIKEPSSTPQTPTPETDAFDFNLPCKIPLTGSGEDWFLRYAELLLFARKLERERDEARAKCKELQDAYDMETHNNESLRESNEQNEGKHTTMEAELAQLRKVCDELAHIAGWNRNRTESDVIKVMTNYSTLPHVIKAKEQV